MHIMISRTSRACLRSLDRFGDGRDSPRRFQLVFRQVLPQQANCATERSDEDRPHPHELISTFTWLRIQSITGSCREEKDVVMKVDSFNLTLRKVDILDSIVVCHDPVEITWCMSAAV